MLQAIKESLFLFLSFCVGLYAFRYLSLFYRIVFLQVCLALLCFVAAHAIVAYQQANHLPQNNHWMYNIYIFLEGGMLISASMLFFQERSAKKIILAGLALFVLTFFFQMMRDGIWLFANNALIIEGVIIVLIYLVVLYRAVQDAAFHWKSSPELWLCLALALYFGCNVPFMGMLHYLYAHYPEATKMLFYVITDVLGSVRYLLFAISFWLVYRRQMITTG